MRRVLVLTPFFPPLAGGGVHRVLSFVRHLPARGWACTVVCAGGHDYWVRDESLLEQVPPATEVLRVTGGSALAAWLRLRGKADSGRRSGAAFAPLRSLADWWLLPDSYAGWSHRARGVAAERASRGDVHVVLSSSPPDSAHLAALELKRATGLPWVADFRDPWIGLHFRKPPTSWHAARHAAMQASVTGSADLVLTASRTHERELASRVVGRPRRLLHLPNGFEPVTGPVPNPDVSNFRVAFTGTLSLMDDMGTLLKALERILHASPRARDTLRVELVGPYDSDWEARTNARGLGSLVRFTGPRSHAETRALQRSVDALLLWKPRADGYRTMVPGKLYEYLDSGRPIVALLPEDDEAAALVRRAGGRVLPPGDAGALAGELTARLDHWRETGRTPDARPEWLDDHTREHLAGELARALDSLVERA